MDHKTWTLYKEYTCSELFPDANFSCIWNQYGRYRVNPCIQSKYGEIRTRPTPNAKCFEALDVRILL